MSGRGRAGASARRRRHVGRAGWIASALLVACVLVVSCAREQPAAQRAAVAGLRGAEPFPEDLARRLAAATADAENSRALPPRTRHLAPTQARSTPIA